VEGVDHSLWNSELTTDKYGSQSAHVLARMGGCRVWVVAGDGLPEPMELMVPWEISGKFL
jgi:hypothetical protein